MLRVVKVAAVLTAALVCAFVAADAARAAVPTKREFIRKGDALCTEVVRQLVPLRRRAEAAKALPAARQWSAATAIWSDQIAIQARFNTKFRAIGVPRGDALATRLVSGLDRGLVLARRVRDGFSLKDTAALAVALPAYVEFTLGLNRRVQAYGFRVCGKS
jgi:hypothetical protein